MFFLSRIFLFNSVTGEVFNNLTGLILTILNIMFKHIRLGSTINADDITLFFKYKVKVILTLHTEKGHVQKNISALLYRKLDTYHRKE